VVSVTALRDEESKIIGYLLIGTDNTVRKQIEDERRKLDQQLRDQQQILQQKNVELEEASRMKSEFLANMSHELRTPLNAIIGFSEVLGDGLIGNLSDQQKKFIGDIFSSGKHLLSLINDILDLSKVEAGKMMLDLESVQISSLFANSLSIVKEKAHARHIGLTLNAPRELGSIRADSRKVKQIVYNLLSNAVKFSTDGGEVTIEARRVYRDEVGVLRDGVPGRVFPLAENGFEEFLEISVTDGGIGITPLGMETLFKPFSQIDSGLARKYQGTGLGLAMIKLLSELHGGTLAVESAVGNGSRFTVWLPLRPSDEKTRDDLVAVVGGADMLPGDRIALVIEDDYKSADLIRVQLESEGFRILHAPTAEEALVLAEQHTLSLITLDLMLPRMDGWELLGRLKQMKSLKHVPIVIVSIVADRNKGFALGAAAVMQKPLSRQELYDSLVALGLIPLDAGGTLQILIVDDDPRAVDLVALHVEGLASKILRAYGGRDAIDIARREMPDLIVLDLMMPDVTGFDVVAALHEQPGTANIPILIVTSKTITPEDRRKLNGLVATILEKGDFDGSRLASEVRRAVSRRHVAL
jgi:signal transduction histidine kinase/CheY-like chemotaxis protein